MNERKYDRKKHEGAKPFDTMGMMPPHAIELEKAILGAVMIEPDVIDRMSSIRPEMFFNEQNRCVLQAILDLHVANNPIDIISVGEQLRKNEKMDFVGGDYFLVELTMMVTMSSSVEYHCAVIYENYVKREVIKLCGEKIRTMYDRDADVFLEKQNLVNDLDALTTGTIKEFKSFESVVMSNFEKIKEIQEKGLKVTGINTGFHKLNNLTCGWQDTDLIIIGARPGTGKSAFALNIAENVAKQGIPVAVFSLEMSSNQMVDRIVSKVTSVDAFKMKSATVSEGEWQTLNSYNYNLPIFIDDTASLNVVDFKAKARRAAKQHGIKFIIVDYLQLMSTYTKGNRDQQIGEISRALKQIAKELKVPVIALSQLSRDSEKSKRRPMLSDLRESGNIEQDADIIIFLHDIGDPSEQLGDIELLVAKHRAGALGIINMDFFKKRQEFKEKISEYAQPRPSMDISDRADIF